MFLSIRNDDELFYFYFFYYLIIFNYASYNTLFSFFFDLFKMDK